MKYIKIFCAATSIVLLAIAILLHIIFPSAGGFALYVAMLIVVLFIIFLYSFTINYTVYCYELLLVALPVDKLSNDTEYKVTNGRIIYAEKTLYIVFSVDSKDYKVESHQEEADMILKEIAKERVSIKNGKFIASECVLRTL